MAGTQSHFFSNHELVLPICSETVSRFGLAGRLAQCGNGMSWGEAHGKLVVVSATDHCCVVGVFSHPDDPFGIHKDFQSVHIFKHYKLHDASFFTFLCALIGESRDRSAVRAIVQMLKLDSQEGICR
jgi:hypothetical protein